MIAIPKGAKNLDLAYKFLAYAARPRRTLSSGVISPMVRFADAAPFVAGSVAKLPNAPDHMTPIWWRLPFWGDHGADLVKRFNAWLAR